MFVESYYLSLSFFQVLQSAVLKNEKKKILLKKDASHLKISQEKQKKNVGKRERKTKNEKKSVFFFCVAGYIKCSNKTPTPAKKCIGLVDVVLRSKILGNRLGILT